MKRLKQKRYKKYKELLKDSVAKTLERSSERAKKELKRRGAIRLFNDMIKAEQEINDAM
jgi:hypothetical protein